MEKNESSSTGGFKPPYNLAFRTFLNLVHRLQQEPIPPRIDRTYLSKLSGTDQTHLMGALRAFGLIDDRNKVHADLGRMAKDEAFRREKLADLLRTFYPAAVQMSQENATQGMLEESFSEFGITGDSRRKAVTFYLKAAEYAGMTLSPHFKVPKDRAPRATGRTSGGGAVRKRTTSKRKRSSGRAGGGKAANDDSQSVTLESGGTVTLTVDVPWLQLSKEDYEFVWSLVDKLREYAPVVDEDEEDEEEGEQI